MRRQMWARALAVALSLGGVAAPVEAQTAGRQGLDQIRSRQAFRAEAVDRETRTLAIGPEGSLTLSNITGDITVRAGQARDITLEIFRRSRGATDEDARRGLERVRVVVDEGPNRATVASMHGQERAARYSVQVAYDVTVPVGTSVNIRSLGGNIEATGLSGELSAMTTTGNIAIRDARKLSRARTATGRVLLTNVENDGTIEAGTIAGEVMVEAVRARRLLVGTVTGPVTARDATTERAELTTTAGAIEFAGTVAADGLYELRTHTGDIRFIPLGGAGFELRAVCFTGRIVPASDLGLVVIRKSPQELVGTVGDGGAVVTLSTFSGGIAIGRR